MQPDARMVVMAAETAPLFQVTKTGTALTLATSGSPMLSLTPPKISDLQDQLKYLRSAADLRADRMPEIMMQAGDMLSFYGSLFNLHPARKRWTMELLAAAYQCVILPEMQMKRHASLPRPFDFSRQLQPIIETPAHSTYPSGHATEAFAFATLLSALAFAGAKTADPAAAVVAQAEAGAANATTPEMIPFRLAARIAENRTVAGVHFPVDSAHGALLGLATGLRFVAACATTAITLPTWAADGAGWKSSFTIDLWCKSLTLWKLAATLTTPAADPSSPLAMLWGEAVKEWA